MLQKSLFLRVLIELSNTFSLIIPISLMSDYSKFFKFNCSFNLIANKVFLKIYERQKINF